MPTYEYRCVNGHEFEKFYRTMSTAKSELPCPECGAPAERHLSVGAGLVFKGSGFYLTDYGRNAHANRGDSKPSPQADGGGDASSSQSGGDKQSADAKPADSSTSPPATGEKNASVRGAKESAATTESSKGVTKGEEAKKAPKRDAKSDR